MNSWILIIGLVALLLGAAVFLPSNTLTGHVVKEGTCEGLGCSELCDKDATNNTCGGGLVCCPTQWSTGLCDYQTNCEKIREYSVYQSLETYQDNVREQPSQVDAGWRTFFLPLILVVGVMTYFIIKRKDPELAFKKE